MEHGILERQFLVDASPEVVYEVVSSSEHISQWWTDEADVEPVAGAVGELVWGDRAAGQAQVVTITVVDADPPRLFSFRWVQPDGEAATGANSLLVTFELVASGAGTLVRFTESGFREMGWEAAVLEQQYEEHSSGWDMFLPRLRDHVVRLVSTS